MRTAWDDNEDELQQAQEDAFGEYFTYEPRLSRPNKPTVIDPARPVVSCIPVVFTQPADSDRLSHKYLEHSTRNPAAEIRLCLLPYEVKQHDVVVQNRSGRRFEITNIRPNGHGVAKLDLVEMSLSPQRP